MTASPLPPATTWVSPYIIVKDVDTAAKFYLNAFKIETKECVLGEDNTTWHAELKYKDQLIMLGKEGAYNSLIKAPQTTGIPSPMKVPSSC